MHRRLVLGLLTVMLGALCSLVASPPASAADRDCSDFASQRAAQIFFLNHGGPRSDPHRLDSDGDGIACETNPAPYYYGTTPPGGGSDNPPPGPTAVKSTVQLSLDPGKRITGESYRLKVTVKPAISRKVAIQRKVNGRWKSFASGTTSRAGKFSKALEAPKAKVTYRATVQTVTKGNKKYSAAMSKARTLSIQRQLVELSFDDRNVAEGDQVQASVQASPVRTDRPVTLQKRTAGTWETVRTGTLNRRGRASFTVKPELGQNAYRAVVLRFKGAVPAHSDTETVTAADVTPPPVPFNLVATPGDATVQLSWSRNLTPDFARHDVYLRTDTTTWTLVTSTSSQSVEITSLQNGTTYWFAVTSVDSSGNASAKSIEVSATPAGAAPRQPRRLVLR